jgi:CRISPR-associated protein Csy2
MKQYLLLKRLAIQNANALSSPFTYGFPAVTAFLGFAHALQRRLNELSYFKKLQISGVGIACHTLQMQDHKGKYQSTLKLTANPLDQDGSRPSFVEEGRCHLVLSLVLELEHLSNGLVDDLYEAVASILQGKMKLAGGDILPLESAEQQILLLKDEQKSFRKLLPSYALIERRDLMMAAMQSGKDALDALHDALKINYTSTPLEPVVEGNDTKAEWSAHRTYADQGWIVPIATGFHALTPAAIVEHQRDESTPHRFAESVVTLGAFVMPLPSRFNSLSELIWRYAPPQNDLYLCTQQNQFSDSEVL